MRHSPPSPRSGWHMGPYALNLWGLGPFRVIEIPPQLQVHPEGRRGAEIARKAQGRARHRRRGCFRQDRHATIAHARAGLLRYGRDLDHEGTDPRHSIDRSHPGAHGVLGIGPLRRGTSPPRRRPPPRSDRKPSAFIATSASSSPTCRAACSRTPMPRSKGIAGPTRPASLRPDQRACSNPQCITISLHSCDGCQHTAYPTAPGSRTGSGSPC